MTATWDGGEASEGSEGLAEGFSIDYPEDVAEAERLVAAGLATLPPVEVVV